VCLISSDVCSLQLVLYCMFVQLSQLEEELNQSWKEKCDRLLNSAQEKHERALAEVMADKQTAEDKLRLLESKVHISVITIEFFVLFVIPMYKLNIFLYCFIQ